MRDPAQPADAHARACVADARITDGRITILAVDSRAGWGFGSIKACSTLLAACTGDARAGRL